MVFNFTSITPPFRRRRRTGLRPPSGIKLGIALELPEGLYGRVAPRSGLAARHSLHVGAGVVDASYRGELAVLLFNLGDEDYQGRQSVSTARQLSKLVYYYHCAGHAGRASGATHLRENRSRGGGRSGGSDGKRGSRRRRFRLHRPILTNNYTEGGCIFKIIIMLKRWCLVKKLK